jgi:hypothetical protein
VTLGVTPGVDAGRVEQKQTKFCPRCGPTLDVAEFKFKDRATGRRQPYCRQCSREYGRLHYQRTTAYYVRKAMMRQPLERRAVHEKVLAYLRSHPCVDCGETHPVVLDFDHIDPATKRMEIGRMLLLPWSWRTIQAEIAKCAVRCANCHRRRTARQFGWYRLLGGDQDQRP